MAHFAELDENNKVIRVVVIHNNECLNNGVEDENLGILFCKKLFGNETKWKQTSYNGSIRKNFAAPGFTYDTFRDAFVAPKPFESWYLDDETCNWHPPVPMPISPDEETYYVWDEENVMWVTKQL